MVVGTRCCVPVRGETYMLRRIIQRSPFAGLLGMAATYTLAATLGVIMVADGLARAPVWWP
jgi:hypothetical protein